MNTSLLIRVGTAVRHQWLLVAAIVALGTSAAVLALVFIHAKYSATTTVLMVAEPPEVVNPDTPSSATKPLLSMDLPSLATGDTVLARFRHDLGEDITFQKLRLRIRAKVSLASNVMPVQYTALTSDGAVAGANMLGDEIVRFYRDTATSRFDSLIADYRGQLARRRVELSRLDGDLATDARTYPFIDVDVPNNQANSTQSVYDRLIVLRTERAEALATLNADVIGAQAANRIIADAGPIAQRDIVNSDIAYRGVRDQYAKDFAALKRLSAFGSDRYPGVVELRATVIHDAAMVESARRQAVAAGLESNGTYAAALDAKVKADALSSGDRAKLATIDAELSRLAGQMGHGSIAVEVARTRRERESAETAYSTIAARLAKAVADRAEAASTGSVIVLDRAQSAPKDVFTGGEVVSIGIMFLAIWLAFTLAVMVDDMFDSFRDAQTIETIYGTKLIGSIA